MDTKIVCPTCGAEYFPQEIFVLSEFNNFNIVKDENGKILDNLNIDTNESYICDYCNEPFHATMDISLSVSKHATSQHVTKLKKTSLFLDED